MMQYSSTCGGVVGICSRCIHLVRSSPTTHPQGVGHQCTAYMYASTTTALVLVVYLMQSIRVARHRHQVLQYIHLTPAGHYMQCRPQQCWCYVQHQYLYHCYCMQYMYYVQCCRGSDTLSVDTTRPCVCSTTTPLRVLVTCIYQVAQYSSSTPYHMQCIHYVYKDSSREYILPVVWTPLVALTQ